MYTEQFQLEIQRLDQDDPPNIKLGGSDKPDNNCKKFIDDLILNPFKQLIDTDSTKLMVKINN